MLVPTGDYILVSLKKEDLGGLVVPDGAEGKDSQKGEVIAVGPGKYDVRSDRWDPIDLTIGDVIVWQKYADADYTMEEKGVTYTLIDRKQVMAKEE